jgi:hypothetical protein
MDGNHAGDPELTGSLYTIPFKNLIRDDTIQERLRELAQRVDGSQIDVVTRFPTGVDQVETALDRDPTAETQSLSVETLSEHALSTVNECTEDMQWISAAAENTLLFEHAAEYEWDSEYLQSASEHDTFYQDLRSFVADAMRYPDLGEAEDPVIADLITFTQSYYEFLVGQDYVPREAVVRLAVEQFREQGVSAVSQPAGLLAVQFAEFTSVERLYLAYLTQGRDFEGIARKNASVFRTQFEAGRIDHQTALNIERRTNPKVPNAPAAIGEWLAEGGDLSIGADKSIRRLEAKTYEEHVRTIGTAIQQLVALGENFNDIAIVFRDAGSPIGDAVDILWNMGVPVSSTVTGGLEHDTAVRELYMLVECLAALTQGATIADLDQTHGLEARLDGIDYLGEPTNVVHRVLSEITAIDNLEHGLARWINETQLKHRVAVDGEPLQQRLTFDHIQRVLDLAQFIENSSEVEGSWSRFKRAIEFEADYTASEQVAAELESQEAGVTVDTVGSLKGADFKFVFVAGVVDDEYPAGPMLNRLIPITRTADIDVYPRALPKEMEAVRQTFATPEPPTEHPVRAYSQSLNRRILAEAARMGNQGLYFVTYENAPEQVGKQVHPSRYLSAIDSEIGGLSSDSESTEVVAPQQVALNTVDKRYREAKRNTESLPDEETLDAEFGAVRTILENSDEAFREALASRRDWDQGVLGGE